MTTRAEEIAAKEYPDMFIRDDKMKTSGTALISDAAQMLRREGFINGYKHGQQDRWISVEERLPEEGLTVLVWSPTCLMHSMRYYPKSAYPWRDNDPRDECSFSTIPDATHWMPLPSPPNPEQR